MILYLILAYHILFATLIGLTLYSFRDGDWRQMAFWMLFCYAPLLYVTLPFMFVAAVCRPDLTYKWFKKNELLPWQKRGKKR
jgi:hypothetical protein